MRFSRRLDIGSFTRCGISFVFLCCLVTQAFAVVVADGDGRGNTTPPEDDPGFHNVGARGIASAVYLGERWVMTAAHVAEGTVTFDGVDYPHEPGSAVRIQNPPGLSRNADLVLFQLVDEPPLPALHLPCSAPQKGDELIMVGRGRDRQESLALWSVSVVGGRNNDVWARVESEEEADEQGFLTTNDKTIRWGRNVISKVGSDVDTGGGDVLSFQTQFDLQSGVDDEAHSVTGDSGGAGFSKLGSIWELTGLIHAVDLKDNQPGRANTAIFGNDTFFADLFLYGDEIREITNFAPAGGDFNGDGAITAEEIDQLFAEIRSGADICHFDLDRDDSVTLDDLTVLLSSAGTHAGDLDLDGEVGFQDFLTLSRNFGMVATWSGGDLTGDGMVTFGDFLVLSDSFGMGSSVGAQSVPEPSAIGLFLVGLLFCRRIVARQARQAN